MQIRQVIFVHYTYISLDGNSVNIYFRIRNINNLSTKTNNTTHDTITATCNHVFIFHWKGERGFFFVDSTLENRIVSKSYINALREGYKFANLIQKNWLKTRVIVHIPFSFEQWTKMLYSENRPKQTNLILK